MAAWEVVILVAGAAFHRGYAVPIRTTAHIHGVPVIVVALAGKISAGMAVHAARVVEHRQHSFECGCCAGVITRRRAVNVRDIAAMPGLASKNEMQPATAATTAMACLLVMRFSQSAVQL